MMSMEASAKAWLVVACLLAGTRVSAQPADPGDIGIYFDRGAVSTATNVTPFEPFTVYVISTVVPNGQSGYEFLVDMDPRLSFVSEALPASTWDFGMEPVGSNRRNYLVSILPCNFGEGSTEVLAAIKTVLVSAATDVLLCLEPAEPSSFSPPRPGYVPCCSACDLRPYGRAYEGCAVANPIEVQPPVSTRSRTWGALKANY